ncbi:MAG: hemerythrin domain-containing protein [Chthonomonadales bacterium]
MTIQINAPTEHSFDTPIELLSDCHRRIERFLDQMIAVVDECRGGELDRAHRDALETAMRYFRQAAPLHTADEEVSLFPRLRRSGQASVQEALDVLDRLEQDHIVAAEAHTEIDALAQKWLSAGVLEGTDVERLSLELHSLRSMYNRHIALEDGTLFPLAGTVLPPAEVAQLGREMAVRRGLDPDRLPTQGRCAERRARRNVG